MPVLLAPAAAEIFGGTSSGEIYRRLWLTVPLANFVGTTIMSKVPTATMRREAWARMPIRYELKTSYNRLKTPNRGLGFLSHPTSHALARSRAQARDSAYSRYATQLAADVDSDAFVSAFGAPKSELASLISSKTVTLPLLLKLSPEGTPDPSPFLYNDVFYGIAGCGALALVCNVAAFQLPIRARVSQLATR